MFQRLCDWWTINSKPASSPEYEAAMERRMPRYAAMRRSQAAGLAERRARDAAWWQSVCALQGAGEIARAVAKTEANIADLERFVFDPIERIAMLYDREVDRLLAHGDHAGAVLAGREASRWMSIWASHSTSGGEGTARSAAAAEMDAKIAQKLGPTPEGSAA